MELKTYLQKRTQAWLARQVGVTPGAVNQWVSGSVVVPVDRCIQIEKATEGEVRCEDLRPDVDWAFLRGTNCEPKQPPALAQQAQAAMQSEGA